MQTVLPHFIVKNLITFPHLRPLVATEKGGIDVNPSMRQYMLCPKNADRFERICYRYNVRLLFKKISGIIRKFMCYDFSFTQGFFYLRIQLSIKKAKKLGIKLSYRGKTIREIYESLCKDLSVLLHNVHVAMAIYMSKNSPI